MRCAPPQSPGVSPLDKLLGPRWPAEGHTKEVDSSSPASFSSPLYRLTTPATREEQGTSLYLRSNIAPHAPRAGSAKEATSGVSSRPASPGPGYSGPASLTPSPPGLALAAGAIAGAVRKLQRSFASRAASRLMVLCGRRAAWSCSSTFRSARCRSLREPKRTVP